MKVNLFITSFLCVVMLTPSVFSQVMGDKFAKKNLNSRSPHQRMHYTKQMLMQFSDNDTRINTEKKQLTQEQLFIPPPENPIHDANWREIGPKSSISNLNNLDNQLIEMDRNVLFSTQLNPRNPNIIWAATYGSGVWKTVNGGKTWQDVSRFNVDGAEIDAMTADPTDPNTVYIASSLHSGESIGVFKTSDGGRSWTLLRKNVNPGFSGVTWDVRVNHINNQHLITLGSGDIQYSVNGGVDWIVSYQSDFIPTGKFAYSPAQPNTVFALVSDNNGYKVIKSKDFGKTWEDTNLKNITWDALMFDIAVAPTDANTVYTIYSQPNASGTTTTLMRSTDGGNTWSLQSNYENFTDSYLNILVDIDDKNKLYVAGNGLNGKLPDGVFISKDAGKTLRLIGSSIKAFSKNPVGVVIQDMQQHPLSKELFCSFFIGGIYKLNTRNMHSADMSNFQCPTMEVRGTHVLGWNSPCIYVNNNWVRISDKISGASIHNIDIKNNDILAASESGALKWDGYRWTKISSVYNGFTSTYGADDVFYGGDKNTFYIMEGPLCTKTMDGGRTLKNILPDEAIPEPFFYKAPSYISSKNPNTIYILKNHLWKTTNGGDTWRKIVIPNPTPENIMGGVQLAIPPCNENIIYAASNTFTGQRYVNKSTDGGNTWENIGAELPALFLDRMIVNPENPNQVWLLYQRGQLWTTTDGGKNWSNISSGLPPFLPYRNRALKYDTKNKTLYVGSEAGVYIKTPNDTQFRAYNDGLPKLAIYDFEFDYRHNKVYAASGGSGLWVGNLYQDRSCYDDYIQNPETISTKNTLTAYPNPANNIVNITVQSDNETEWMVRVTNITGQVVLTKSGKFSQNFDMNTDNLKNGLYFIQCQKGDEVKSQKIIVQH